MIRSQSCRSLGRFLLFILAVLLLASGQARAVEVVGNGDFSTGLTPWYLERGFDPTWSPVTQGAADLNPPTASGWYQGPVLVQPVNVTGIGGQTATVGVDLWQTLQTGEQPQANPVVGILCEYVDTAGQIHEVSLLAAAGTAVSTDAANPARLQDTFTFPADADRLVEVSLARLTGGGTFYADNVSVDVAGASALPVPQITGVTPTQIAYGDTVTITGANFGASQGSGELLLNDQAAGLTVTSWSDSQIVVQVNAPAMPGSFVVRQGTESAPSPGINITSPFFYLRVADLPERVLVLAGATLRLPLGIGFANGYTLPASAAINWSLVDKSGAAPPSHAFKPQSLSGPGGTLLTVDTSAMTPGLYTFAVQASDGVTTVSGEAEVEVRKVGKVEFFDTVNQQVITSVTVNQQGEFGNEVELKVYDSQGQPFPREIAPVEIVSSDPSVVLVSSSMDDVKLYAVGNGQANIVLTFADGFQATLPVTVSLPASSPQVTVTVTPATLTNTQTGPVTFAATASAGSSLTNAGFSASFLNLQQDASAACGYNSDNTQYSCQYNVDLNDPANFPTPGISSAVFHASATSGSATATGYALFTVTNDDTAYAKMEGVVASFDPQIDSTMIENGVFEFYDPTNTSQPSFIRNRIGPPSENGYYRLAGIWPGTYLVRYVTPSGMGQWFPGGGDATGAQQLTFVAGQLVSDINFLFAGQGMPSDGGDGSDTTGGTGDTTGDTGGTGDATGGGSGILFTPQPTSGPAPLDVTFTCAPDPASGASVASADFDFDHDGTYEVTGDADGIVTHTYTAAGTYDAICRLTDDTGKVGDSLLVTITVTDGTGGTGGDTGDTTGGTSGDTTGSGVDARKWDCNGNGIVDLPDILCQLMQLAGKVTVP